MKVLKKFRDKYSGKIYIPGNNFMSDDVDRINDLIIRGLIEGEIIKPSIPSYDDITRKEIIERLEAKNIEYNAKASKRELYELLGGD
jgi:hypothetical protein